MMKAVTFVLLVAVGIGLSTCVWCGCSRVEEQAAVPAAGGPAREFFVDDMTCGGCTKTVTEALSKLPGVQSVNVTLNDKKARVVADPNAVPDEKILAAIAAAGYTGRVAGAAPAAKAAPTAKETPAAKEPTGGKVELGVSYGAEIPANLGEPLVDAPQSLQRLDKTSPVWIDKQHKTVVLLGTTCKAGYPLEFFATYPDRSYESVVVIYTKPSVVHAALLALGAKPGKPVAYEPTFVPPSGNVVNIDVAWKDAQGKPQKARAQDWIREIKTKKPLDVSWVFTGSRFYEDKETGVKSYLADRGDFISVLNLPTALLDVPIKSASALESRIFEGAENLPAPGTPVTITLKPQLEATAPH